MNSIHNAHVEQTSFVMSSHQIKQNKKKRQIRATHIKFIIIIYNDGYRWAYI